MAVRRKEVTDEAEAGPDPAAAARLRRPAERRLEAVSSDPRERLPLMVEPEFALAALLAAASFYVAVAPDLLLAAACGISVGATFLVLLWRRPGLDAPIAATYAASAWAIVHATSGGDAVAAGIVAGLAGAARLAEGWRRGRRKRPGREHDPYA